MLFLEWLLYIISFFFLLNGWQKVIRIKLFKKGVITNKKNKNNLKFILLIPIFKESQIIKETVSYFQKVESENTEVYYITTNKEVSKISWKNDTLEILLQYIDKKHIINYPYITWDKAWQLNYAVKYLIWTYDSKYTYFWVFDADSRPDFWALNYITFDKGREPLYQMLSVYNTNYNRISNICRANAVLQTRRSFYFEYDKLQKNNERGYHKYLMYLIWHWLFIRGDLLWKYLFPENSITEDIVYGYQLCLKWVFAKPLPYYDYCSVPNKLSTNVKQISRRFYGEFEAIWKYISNKDRSKKLFYKRFIQLIFWWYWWIIILLAFIMAFIWKFGFVLIILSFWLLMDGISFIKVMHKMLENKHNKVIIYFYSILKNIIDAVPLTISIYKLIYNCINKRKQEFIKTER